MRKQDHIMNLKEEKIKSTKVFDGKLLKVYKDEVLCPNNDKTTREYVIHCKAAAILPITDQGKIILEKQYRYPISKEYIEVPAGKANDGESIENTAKRELEEETGLKASKLIKVGEIYPACAYSTEDITLFIAKNLKKGNIHRDEDEFIELITVDSKEFIKMCLDGRITDAKTIALAFYYQQSLLD